MSTVFLPGYLVQIGVIRAKLIQTAKQPPDSKASDFPDETITSAVYRE
jgi:hypothetical protein